MKKTGLVSTLAKIFFAIWHLIAFDELQHDYKNPVDQCNSLNPLVLPEYAVHLLIVVLMFSCGEMSSATINIPLLRFKKIYRENILKLGFQMIKKSNDQNSDY